MLTKEKILALFDQLNSALKERGEIGEIGLVGGAVMCLVYNARISTKDVDAIFEPTTIMRDIARQIGAREGLPPDWLNDAAKGFILPGFTKHEVLNLSHLRIWAPEPRYMLAMKCISARWDSADRDDVLFLIRYLKLNSTAQVFEIIESFYPKNQIPAKTQFFIEEAIEGLES
jgi:hypothetical protein